MTINRESIRKIVFKGVTTGKRLAAVHLGEVLLKEFCFAAGQFITNFYSFGLTHRPAMH